MASNFKCLTFTHVLYLSIEYLHLRPISFVGTSSTDKELNESVTGKLFDNSRNHFLKTLKAIENQTIITGSTKFGYTF